MRLIPGKTKVRIELFRGVYIGDLIVGAITLGLVALVLLSTIPGRVYISVAIGAIGALFIMRIDSQPNYRTFLSLLKYLSYPKKYWRVFTDDVMRSKAEESHPGEKWSEMFAEKFDTDDDMTLRESIERIMEEKAKKKEEDKILNSKTANDEQKNAVWREREQKQSRKAKDKKDRSDSVKGKDVEDIVPFTGISGGFIEYNGKYYATIIEIDPVEFRFFSRYKRNASIETHMGKIIRSLRSGYAANIIKIDRPIVYNTYLDKEYDKLDELKASYEQGLLTEEELQSRVEIQYERINAIREICFDKKIVQPFYYLALFNIDKRQLLIDTDSALSSLEQGELTVRRLVSDKELAVFLKYTNYLDFDEWDIDKIDPQDYVSWAMPESISFNSKTVRLNKIVTHQMRVVGYPSDVGDSWLAGVMSIPGTKVVVKITPMERTKAIHAIDRSLQELRGQYRTTGVDSKKIELESHIQTLGRLLVTLQQDNESLLTVNIYISMYDSLRTTEVGNSDAVENTSLPTIADMKKTVRRSWQETGMRLNAMDFAQTEAFIASQVSAYDPFLSDGRGMPANTIAAMFPWIYARVSDEGGIWLGNNEGVPVFINFFRRDSERVNSNMVIIGKSGSGKSYGTKSILANMASEDAKIFILDPENEYTELSKNLHGKIIDVGNAKYGRLNPFHIITSLEDDDTGEVTGSSYASHLQFLEEFFRQILPDVDKEALEYLNQLVERLYINFGITAETDLSQLTPFDYPVFDDLYDIVLEEFQRTNNEYLRNMLQTLMNYVSKFAAGGRNSNIWNGPSTITTDENFSVFNFQSLLANRNSTIANAQMLLVLKYIDNEIIKNREYNRKYGLNRKIVVVIDEAHVFIDTKFPIALDFMYQLAKRIRKYNGMQIVITQNIKDFVGSEEIARKSTAIINACQYSFIFGLAPNDMEDLCRLYEKAGGINEMEQEQILTAPRGTAFTVMGPQSRSTFRISVPSSMVEMFEQPVYESKYFVGQEGYKNWEDFVADSREIHQINAEALSRNNQYVDVRGTVPEGASISFSEISAQEADEIANSRREEQQPKVTFSEVDMQPESGMQGITDESIPVPPVQQAVPVVPVAPVEPAQPVQPVDMQALIAAVREEVMREFADRLQPAEPQPQHQSAPEYEEEYEQVPEYEDEYDDEQEEDDEDYRSALFDDIEDDEDDEDYYDEDDEDIEEEYASDDDDDEEADLGDVLEDDLDDDDDDEGYEPKFDIMALLDEQLESYNDMDLVDRMKEIDVNTMEISLDYLAAYVMNNRRKRRA